jgi:CDP-glycerol glycerophosphotransferase (TagB/SpsB family)
MLTDYSSTQFDFGYLKKPVVYTHFDRDEFFSSHTYIPGYFTYEDDGFGEVVYDFDSTVDILIEYMENGCELKDKYLDRINGFYAYTDKNNSQRIFDEIKKLK